MKTRDSINLIKFKAEAILRREVMEANCMDFTELAEKMAKQIVSICDWRLANDTTIT